MNIPKELSNTFSWWEHHTEGIAQLLGKTLISIKQLGNDELIFTTDQGIRYRMLHYQDCCEYVSIEDINGDLEDLIGSRILAAEETTNKDDKKEDSDESFTWTFYKIATAKGYVTIRWYGTSNGYYSEAVDFKRI